MRKLTLISLIAAMCVATNVNAQAAVEVTWEKPQDFTDVRPSNETRVSFRKRVFADLEKYFTKLAEDLPDEQTLKITVTDLDLAGQVWPSSFVGFGAGGSDVRVIKRIDIPRMKFSYTLEGADGQVVKSADVALKDMSFMDGANSHGLTQSLRYEKNMLKEWFDDEMGDHLVKQ